MAFTSNNKATKTDLVNEFNTRVRQWVINNNTWLAGSVIFYNGYTLGQMAANSAAYGTSTNRTVAATLDPVSLAQGNLSDRASGSTTASGTIVKALKDFLTTYANNHKVQLYNTGNTPHNEPVDAGSSDSTEGVFANGVAPFNGNVAASITAVQTDVDAAAVSTGMVAGNRLTASRLEAFMTACQNIWTNRCLNAISETFYYNYCHNSCHSNVTCYNSRGRR